MRLPLGGGTPYPHEVVIAALHHNAATVIFSHNHPSGIAEPSRSDENFTTSLKQALALVDVRVLDHFIVAGIEVLSFANGGCCKATVTNAQILAGEPAFILSGVTCHLTTLCIHQSIP
jgi:hypothetical protein